MKNEDRLSRLPDILLQHILSFLDIKYAVQTSILSKRWTLVWISLPILSFHLSATNHGFIDKLFLHRDVSNIQKLHFSADNYTPLNDLSTWLIAAIRCNLQEFQLMYLGNLLLPHCLFTCQSLTSLKLYGLYNSVSKISLLLPHSIHLPRLKLLHLSYFSFRDECVLNNFFTKCPALESLLLDHFEYDQTQPLNLIISMEKLKHLTIASYFSSCQVYVPNLNSLSLTGSLSANKLTLCVDIPFLDNATLDLTDAVFYPPHELDAEKPCPYLESCAYYARTILQAISNVKSLSLSEEFIQLLPEINRKSLATQFGSLKHLKLRTDLCGYSVRAITFLLEATPNLESHIVEKLGPESQIAWTKDAPDSVSYTLRHLKA